MRTPHVTGHVAKNKQLNPFILFLFLISFPGTTYLPACLPACLPVSVFTPMVHDRLLL
jgi:hypothetical protein